MKWFLLLGLLFPASQQCEFCAAEAGQDKRPPVVTGPKWAVIFDLKRDNTIIEPLVRFQLLVPGTNEGDAAVEGYKELSKWLTIAGQDKLVFVEAQRKE